MLELRDVSFVVDDAAGKKEIIKNINLKIDKGEFVAIIGSSGSGKSTLLHLLGGLDSCTSGKILVDETNIGNIEENILLINPKLVIIDSIQTMFSEDTDFQYDIDVNPIHDDE